jgi:hypothetical protein
MEYWSTGVLVKQKERPLAAFLGFFHYSITPILQYSRKDLPFQQKHLVLIQQLAAE